MADLLTKARTAWRLGPSAVAGALQYRLKPGTLANQAWSGVREKSGEVADDALHSVNDMADGAVRAVKDRPVAASSVAAAILVFLLRAPLWRVPKSFPSMISVSARIFAPLTHAVQANSSTEARKRFIG